jgi:elongation factor G
VPVLAGSAYKNAGIQLLIDSVINYLPSPNERNKIYNCFGKDFVGRVFKVAHDKQRGPLSLVRIYGGELKRGARVMTSAGVSENVHRLYEPLADEYKETDLITAGNVCVCAGLKATKTGDILISRLSSLRSAQKKLKSSNSNINIDESEGDFSLFNFEPNIPPAVFFCSIEPPSAGYQSALEQALAQIQREDPSLRVSFDETTMQTVLGGMGELHLEIIKSRLMTEYKIDADLGPLQIAYKETIDCAHRDSLKIEKEIAGAKQSVEIEMTIDEMRQGDEAFRLDLSPDASDSLKSVRPKFVQLVKRAALSALERGPKLGGEVVNVRIILHGLVVGRHTAESVIAAAASQCVQKVLLGSNCRLMEPMMAVQIVLPTEKVSAILSDLGRRRAQIGDISLQGEHNKLIEFIAPLAELQSYSSIVRTISSGTASLLMQPHGYEVLSVSDEDVAIRRAQGFE